MGSDTGGYVRLRLETQVSEFDEKKGLLRRQSLIGFERAPSPSTRTPKPLSKLAPKLPSGPGPLPGALEAAKAPPAVAREVLAVAKVPPTPAGKVALGGLENSDVKEFDLWALMDDDKSVFMDTVADKTFRDEACKAFGGKWAGFAVRASPSGTRFRLLANIEFKPSWSKNARRPFQIVPVVMAFGTEKFADHYLLALIVAQKTDERIDTYVTQPYQ